MARPVLLATALGAAIAAASPGAAWPLLGVSLLAVPWLGWRWLARRRDSRSAQREAPLFARERLVSIGNQMLARCRNRSEPFAVALVEVSELPEVRKLFGRRIEDEIAAVVERKLRIVATSRGLAVRTGRTQFSLLLPGRSADAALQAVRATLGRAGCVEHDAGGEELVLLPNVKVDAVGPEHAGIDVTYRELCEAMAAMHPRLPATTTATSNLPTEPTPLPAPAADDPRRSPGALLTVPLPL